MLSNAVTVPNNGFITAASNHAYPLPETIKGECVQAQMSVSDFQVTAMQTIDLEKHVKEKLIHMIAEELMHSKLVEYTKFVDSSDGTTMYRARIFATPDSQVRILRKGGHIK
jgi:GTPase Era involved in 16S rRNA processing